MDTINGIGHWIAWNFDYTSVASFLSVGILITVIMFVASILRPKDDFSSPRSKPLVVWICLILTILLSTFWIVILHPMYKQKEWVETQARAERAKARFNRTRIEAEARMERERAESNRKRARIFWGRRAPTVFNYVSDYSGPQSIMYKGKSGLAFEGKFVPWDSLAQSGVSRPEINDVAAASRSWVTDRYLSTDASGNTVEVEVEKLQGTGRKPPKGSKELAVAGAVEAGKVLYKKAKNHMYNSRVAYHKKAIRDGYVRRMQGNRKVTINRQTVRRELLDTYHGKLDEMVSNNEDGGQNGRKLRRDIETLKKDIAASKGSRGSNPSRDKKRPKRPKSKMKTGGGGGGGGHHMKRPLQHF